MAILTSIKNHQKDIILGIIAVSIISIAFSIGYMIGRDYTTPPIIIEKHTSQNLTQ